MLVVFYASAAVTEREVTFGEWCRLVVRVLLMTLSLLKSHRQAAVVVLLTLITCAYLLLQSWYFYLHVIRPGVLFNLFYCRSC